MKIIIVGGRDYPGSYDDFESLVDGVLTEGILADQCFHAGLDEIIHGCCGVGVDVLAREFIEQYDLTASHFPIERDKHGDNAESIRNSEIIESGADLLIAFYNDDGVDTGIDDIIRKAEKKQLPVFIVRY